MRLSRTGLGFRVFGFGLLLQDGPNPIADSCLWTGKVEAASPRFRGDAIALALLRGGSEIENRAGHGKQGSVKRTA